VAALIVTIMLIPQSLAYALLAGLPPEVGLYASVAPLLLYAMFGSSRVLAVGPAAVVSLMTAAAIGNHAVAGSPAVLGRSDHAGFPVGCDAAADGRCCGWASWPTS
jgi:MFS superfamily sulfate permease-like transporter